MDNRKYNNTVIAILTALDEELADYGYAIIAKLKETGLICSHQQLYRELRGLERQQLVKRKDVPVWGKPDRATYVITAKGRQLLYTSEPDSVSKITAFDLALCFKTQRFIDYAIQALRKEIAATEKSTNDDVALKGRLLVIEAKMHILNNLHA